jgi:hypothetical protein
MFDELPQSVQTKALLALRSGPGLSPDELEAKIKAKLTLDEAFAFNEWAGKLRRQ